MEKTIIKVTKITASDKMYLTNGKTFSKEVYLGVNDSPENWQEISEEEYNKILEKHEIEDDRMSE